MAAAAIAVSAAALMAVLLLVGPGLRQRALDHTRQALFAEARLMAHVVEGPLRGGAEPLELDRLVDAAAQKLGARVTIIDVNGRVLADSAVSGPELLALENHADRPEVREAMALRTGSSVRRSATTGQELLYAAVPVVEGHRLLGVSRVALRLVGLEEQASDLHKAVAAALFLAFLVAALLSAPLSSSLAGPLEEIMSAARRFVAGDHAARIRVRRSDELGELARILNRSADELQARLTENARDRARTEAILSAMEEGMLAVDHRGLVLMANDALRRSLDLHDPVGRHYVEAIRQREVGEVIQSVLATGERRALEVAIVRHRRAFALTGVPFPGVEGTPHGAVLTFHDVTERRQLDRVRRDFVANASHELRTPLTSIRGFVEALEDGAIAEPETSQRFLGKIRAHADRMAALVEDLLELSRLESGERPPQWDEVAPGEVADEVVAFFSGLAARRGLVIEREDGASAPVVTDAERLRRILENLVDNAVKYTPSGGRIAVRTGAGAGGGALVEVRDTGPGIAAEHLPRIFERFYRVDKARSREMGGTGLGLSIVKHLAEGMGATVTVESTPGSGTCFRVLLPASGERRAGGGASSAG
jgi:two-component system phosphate regulon sensor histidine kinase PhoR